MPQSYVKSLKIITITSADVKEWIKECAFATDAEAAYAIKVPLRTFGRWKAKGIPNKTMAARLLAELVEDRMIHTLERRRATGKA